jgi:hypothetical protein
MANAIKIVSAIPQQADRDVRACCDISLLVD